MLRRKKNKRKTRKRIKSILLTWSPLLISILALSYAFYIDQKNYSTSYSEDLQLEIREELSIDSLALIYEYVHGRSAVRKRLKIELLNNSNKGIIVRKIVGQKFDTTINHAVNHLANYRYYLVKESEGKFLRKELPFKIESNETQRIFVDFYYILGRESSDYLSTLSKDSTSIFVNKDSLEYLLFDLKIPMFRCFRCPEKHDPIFKLTVETANRSFTKDFAYHNNHENWINE